jgi:hypothetical protein
VATESGPVDYADLVKSLDLERLSERLDALDRERDVLLALARVARSHRKAEARQPATAGRKGATRG